MPINAAGFVLAKEYMNAHIYNTAQLFHKTTGRTTTIASKTQLLCKGESTFAAFDGEEQYNNAIESGISLEQWPFERKIYVPSITR
jgi:hypothetical protein